MQMAGVSATGRHLRRKDEKLSGADKFQAQWQAYSAGQGVTSGERMKKCQVRTCFRRNGRRTLQNRALPPEKIMDFIIWDRVKYDSYSCSR